MENRQAERDFLQLIKKNEKRGVISNAMLTRYKRMGFNVGDKEKINKKELEKITEEDLKDTGRGGMEIDNYWIKYQRQERPINDRQWKPKSKIHHSEEFFDWINSMTFGAFPDKIRYEPFEKYKAQAQFWYDTARNPYSVTNMDLRKEIIFEEYDRIERNTLYYSMRYGWVKEGNVREGKIPFVPKEHTAVIYYLIDCGYCIILGKPRQIFATTTIGLYINKKLTTQENFYMKFITEDVDTGMEILADKVKTPFGYLPDWQRPSVSRDYIKGFKLGKKIEKGEFAYPNSRVEVVAPTKTAINGGSPQSVLVDEIGNVPDLIPMILEALPTLYIDANQDGNLVLTRQILLWGTGVSDNKGKNGYQSLFTSTIELWEQRKFKEALFVPLFFSWHTRCSEKIYKENQLSYYGGANTEIQNYSADEQKTIFAMHFPSVWRDMFGMASGKLIPREFIEDQFRRIRKLPEEKRCVYGFFEPIYDRTKPYLDDNIGIPYRIIGSKFIPYGDNVEDRDRVSAIMYLPPYNNYVNRYYQGTDPIATETGTSNFGSAIWDEHEKTYACIINYRKSQDHKSAFLQSILMSLYYDPKQNGFKTGVPELIENNIGTNYKDYKELLGYDKNMIYNKELPIEMQGGGALWGYNSKQKRKEIMVSNLSEVTLTYGENFNHEVIFKQLETYHPRPTSGGVTWEPVAKMYRDDVLDACAFAYIARKTHYHLMPVDMTDNKREDEYKIIYKNTRLKDGSLVRLPQRVKSTRV